MAGTDLRSKFRGCLVGGLVGDCLGSPFEFDGFGVSPKFTIDQLIEQLKTTPSERETLTYTDDTLMAWDMAQSLVDKCKFDAADMARRFADTYFACDDSIRAYGYHVVDVFSKWKHHALTDPFEAARAQFGGSGSYGNGGAMRIAPVALYANNNFDELLKLVKETTLLTHTHRDGVNGALVQALAIWLALKWQDQTKNCPLDANQFVDKLIQSIEPIEIATCTPGSNKEDVSLPYTDKLKLVKSYVQKIEPTEISDEDIIRNLGTAVTAPESVPTAIYCFLKCSTQGNTTVGTEFEQTVRLAVSLGGDTDTIACMAGSIAGAFLGIENIPLYLQRDCEELDKALYLADKLYSLTCNK